MYKALKANVESLRVELLHCKEENLEIKAVYKRMQAECAQCVAREKETNATLRDKLFRYELLGEPPVLIDLCFQ